jgi:hypothetical protein
MKKILLLAALTIGCGDGSVEIEDSQTIDEFAETSQPSMSSIELVEVPDVEGQTLEFAEGSASTVGLVLVSEAIENAAIEPGIIFEQIPTAGSQVTVGTPLVIRISKEVTKVATTQAPSGTQPAMTTTTLKIVEDSEETVVNEEAILTTTYLWGQSEEAKALQSLLGIEADGYYGSGTRTAHLEELESRDLETKVPSPPTTTGPSWVLQSCSLDWFPYALDENNMTTADMANVYITLNFSGEPPSDLSISGSSIAFISQYPSGEFPWEFQQDTIGTLNTTHTLILLAPLLNAGGILTVDATVSTLYYWGGTVLGPSCSIGPSLVFNRG